MHHGHGHPVRRGISVIELGFGLGALALALAGGVFFYGSRVDAHQSDTAVRDAQRIHDAAEEWRSDNEQGCPTLSQLKHERRLDDEAQTADPWGQRYRLECTDEGSVIVVSPGRDGRTGTPDDVRVPRSHG